MSDRRRSSERPAAPALSAPPPAPSALAVLGLLVAGCQGRSNDGPSGARTTERGSAEAARGGAAAGAGSGGAADWTARCEAALAGAPKLSPVRRVQAVLDGCRPCGDWSPLLRWSTTSDQGGPTTAAIEDAMDACEAYCTPKARQLFLGTLESARGKPSRKPWRQLGETCGEAVSAKPDSRYLSAPFFALDRIARAAAAHPRLAPLLAAIELPLPAASSTGGVFVLAASPVTRPDAGAAHLTVTVTDMHAGPLPRARLGAAGVAVEGGEPSYPGTLVEPKALPAALAALQPDPGAPISVYAPGAMAAGRLVDTVAAAGGARKLVLAVEATGAPEGWNLAGIVPVALGAPPAPDALRLVLGASPDDAIRALKAASPRQLATPPRIAIAEGGTVEGLAKLLGAIAYKDVAAVSLERAPAGPAAAGTPGAGAKPAGSAAGARPAGSAGSGTSGTPGAASAAGAKPAGSAGAASAAGAKPAGSAASAAPGAGSAAGARPAGSAGSGSAAPPR